jgi:hypothetical protein
MLKLKARGLQRRSRRLRVWLLAVGWLCMLALVACGADDDDSGGAGSGAAGGGSGAVSGGGAGGGAGMSSGCGTESFAAIYQDIFAKQDYLCNSPACHGRGAGQTASVGNLELMSKDVAYADLVGMNSDGVLCGDMPRPRVMKGNAAGSLLVQKLRAATVTCGSVMPVTGTPISDAELARISAWINAGACYN